MQRRVSTQWVPVLVCVCLISGGCGGGASDKPKTEPVTGTITLDGTPLADATVTFVPDDKKANPGTGITKADGKYQLATTANPGAMPGTYKVVIEAYRANDGAALKVEEGTDIEQLKMAGQAKQILPPNYSDPTATELKAEVKSGSPNVHDFALKSK